MSRRAFSFVVDWLRDNLDRHDVTTEGVARAPQIVRKQVLLAAEKEGISLTEIEEDDVSLDELIASAIG